MSTEAIILIVCALVCFIIVGVGLNRIFAGQRDRVQRRILALMQDGNRRTSQAIILNLEAMNGAKPVPGGLFYMALNDLERDGQLNKSENGYVMPPKQIAAYVNGARGRNMSS